MSTPIIEIIRSTKTGEDKKKLILACLNENISNLDEKGDGGQSVLHEACLNCDPDFIAWLLKQKPDLISAKSIAGTNVLCYAAKYHNKAAFEYLLNLPDGVGLKLAKAVNNNGLTSLYFAAIGGDVEIFNILRDIRGDTLFKQVAPTSVRSQQQLEEKYPQSNPLAGINEALAEVAGGGHLAMVEYLIRLGATQQPNENGWHPIHIAAAAGHTDVVKFLIKCGANPRQPQANEWENTPLYEACNSGKLATVQLLVDEYKLPINLPNKSGWHPIHIAAAAGHTEIVRFLIKRGANPSQPQANEEENTPLYEACRNGKLATVQVLVDEYKLPINLPNKEGWHPLHIAAAEGHTDVVKFLIKCGANPSQPQANEWENTPLYEACNNGKLATVQVLVDEYKLPINLPNKKGWHPIHLAAFEGHTDVVKFLIKCGANPSQPQANEWGSTPLYQACRNGKLATVQVLVDEYKLPINLPNKKGWHPIHIAAAKGHTDVVRFLIKHGANPRQPQANEWGSTPLYQACRYGMLETAQLLVDEYKLPINLPNKKGWNLIHAVASEGPAEMVRFLIKHGASPNQSIADRLGNTPLHLVAERENNRLDVARTLMQFGALPYPCNEQGHTPLNIAINAGHSDLIILFYQPDIFSKLLKGDLFFHLSDTDKIKLLTCKFAHDNQAEDSYLLLMQDYSPPPPTGIPNLLSPLFLDSSIKEPLLNAAKAIRTFMNMNNCGYTSATVDMMSAFKMLAVSALVSKNFLFPRQNEDITNKILQFLIPPLKILPKTIIKTYHVIEGKRESKEEKNPSIVYLNQVARFYQKLNTQKGVENKEMEQKIIQQKVKEKLPQALLAEKEKWMREELPKEREKWMEEQKQAQKKLEADKINSKKRPLILADKDEDEIVKRSRVRYDQGSTATNVLGPSLISSISSSSSSSSSQTQPPMDMSDILNEQQSQAQGSTMRLT